MQLLIDAAQNDNGDSENIQSRTCKFDIFIHQFYRFSHYVLMCTFSYVSHKNFSVLDDDTIDAQSLLFLIAGYETSSTLLSFAIHILATKPEIQEKLRKHVQELTDGKEMSYELLSHLTYLEGFLLGMSIK